MRERSQEVGHRRFVRLPVAVPVVGRAAQFGDTEVHGTVWNIGEGGLMAKFPVQILPGSVVDLILQPRTGPLAVTGRSPGQSRRAIKLGTALPSATPRGTASP